MAHGNSQEAPARLRVREGRPAGRAAAGSVPGAAPEPGARAQAPDSIRAAGRASASWPAQAGQGQCQSQAEGDFEARGDRTRRLRRGAAARLYDRARRRGRPGPRPGARHDPARGWTGTRGRGGSGLARHGRRLRHGGRPAAAARRGQPAVQGWADLGSAPARPAGEIGRWQTVPPRIRVHARRGPADRHRRAGEGRERQRARSGTARRHRLWQDLHDGQDHRGDAAPGPDPRPEQDAGGAALWRVQIVLSRQRGRVFRLVLRLLSARGLRAALGHLHREGILDQRADRPDAPLRDPRPAGARRRDHRRVGFVHLRYRLGRNLHRDVVHGDPRREDRAAPARRRPRGAAVQAHPVGLRPRHLPGARRRDRAVAGPPGGPRLAHRPVRRRDRGDRRIRSADRQEDQRAEVREGLRQLALRHAAPDAAAGDQGDQARAQRPRRGTDEDGPPDRGPADRAALHLRHRDDRGHRRLQRHRELFALPHRPQARRAAADPVRVPARQRARVHRREPRHRAADRRHVPGRLPPQGDARRIRLPPALLHGQPAASLRGMGRDAAADRQRLGDAGQVGDGADRPASSSSR